MKRFEEALIQGICFSIGLLITLIFASLVTRGLLP